MTDQYSIAELARRSPWSFEQWQHAYNTVGPILWPRLKPTVEALCMINGRLPLDNAAGLMQLIEPDIVREDRGRDIYDDDENV